TIDTSAGNGTVDLNANATYLDDAVTFTRGTGAINFLHVLYSKSGERNDLTFNGATGGAISVGSDVGGNSASFGAGSTALGDVLVSWVSDVTFSRYMAAGSLVAIDTTGRLSLGCSSCQSFFDGAAGYQVRTTGTANNFVGDENIGVNSYVTLSNASAP